MLLVEEVGVGKGLFARYLHNNAARREVPFVDVAVGSISAENSAVEFFGKEEAGKAYQGLLEQAHGGTLIFWGGNFAGMDEETQARLLSALESSTFLRVGGSESIQVNAKVTASTRISLNEEVSVGTDINRLINLSFHTACVGNVLLICYPK